MRPFLVPTPSDYFQLINSNWTPQLTPYMYDVRYVIVIPGPAMGSTDHALTAWSTYRYCRFNTTSNTCGPGRTEPKPACTVWDGMTPGTSGHSDHLLLPFARWASALPTEVDYARLALLFARQLQSWGSPGYPNMTVPAFDYYFEAQLLGNPRFDQGAVKMVVADFAVNFGTDSGDSIKTWCADRGWPLIWSSSTLPRSTPVRKSTHSSPLMCALWQTDTGALKSPGRQPLSEPRAVGSRRPRA